MQLGCQAIYYTAWWIRWFHFAFLNWILIHAPLWYMERKTHRHLFGIQLLCKIICCGSTSVSYFLLLSKVELSGPSLVFCCDKIIQGFSRKLNYLYCIIPCSSSLCTSCTSQAASIQPQFLQGGCWMDWKVVTKCTCQLVTTFCQLGEKWIKRRADKKRKEDSTFVWSAIRTHCWFNILSCSKGVT